MKNIFPKLKIHSITYLLILSYLITGYFKNILIILLIVLFHEIGHILFLKFYRYEIESVEILPFGGITKTNKLINTPINHDLLIYLGGILNQILLFLVFLFLKQQIFIKESTYFLFCKYNFSILLFNILPIRPLDGGEIVRLILEKYYSFVMSQKIANTLSIVFLFLFLFINIKFNLNNYVIVSFLMVKIYILIKEEKFYKNRFFLERFMYKIPYQKIKNENKKNISLLKKDTYHFFKEGKRYISEQELLRQKFDIEKYF